MVVFGYVSQSIIMDKLRQYGTVIEINVISPSISQDRAHYV